MKASFFSGSGIARNAAYGVGMERNYYVYIVRCSDGSFYTGITNSVARRLLQHNEGWDCGSYTFSRRPVELVYSAEFREVTDAISWEKTLKRWSKKKKEALVRGEWRQLYFLAKNASRKIIDPLRKRMRDACCSVTSKVEEVKQCHGEPDEPWHC
jgi:putative endonuclease